MAHDEGGEGAVSYSVHDPGWTDHEALLAEYAWNPADMPPWEAQVENWARGRLGPVAGRYLEAAASLREAAEQPALARCYQYAYSYSRPNLPFPRAYPGEALEGLAAVAGAAAQLASAARQAAAAEDILASISAAVGAEDAAMLGSLRGEAARISGLAPVFAFLLELYQSRRPAAPEDLDSCQRARGTLLGAMARIEACKPGWVVPATLQPLSLLLAFLEQLADQLAAACALEDDAHRSHQRLRWTLDVPYGAEVTHDS